MTPKYFKLRIEDHLRNEFKECVKNNNTDMTTVLNEYIKYYVKKQKRENKKNGHIK